MLLDHDYLVAHVDADLLSWGLRTEWHDGVRLRFADPARTVVEILDRPKLGGGIRHGAEVLETYLDGHDLKLLVEAADRLGNRAVFKRLGYLLEALGLDQPSRLRVRRASVRGHIEARPRRAVRRPSSHAVGAPGDRQGRPGRSVVIPQRELAALRAEWILDQGVIEKDYLLGWLLACIAIHAALNRTWIFKDGPACASATTRRTGIPRISTSQSSAAVPYGKLEATWEAPKAIASSRRRVPLELLRYAGANRLRWRPESGVNRRAWFPVPVVMLGPGCDSFCVVVVCLRRRLGS